MGYKRIHFVDIDHAELLRIVTYEPDTGYFRWRYRPEIAAHLNTVRVGKQAGCVTRIGYRCFNTSGRGYAEHRLAWFYVHGVWPKEVIDHIDGNPLNNAIANLREATRADNSRHSKKNRRNTTGFHGVSRLTDGRFYASISVDWKTKNLGTHTSAELAAHAYDDAARKFHGEFAKINFP